jgi:uncharacterized protein
MSLVTYKGTKFDYLNPKPEMINFEDIFRSLPRLNRFVGHSSRQYSVGEHTLYCAVMAEQLGYSPREQLLVLIHDFTEAYVGDCPAPLKRLLPEFSIIEERVENAICERLRIDHPTYQEHLKVKRIDLTMLAIEMRDLTVHEYENFIDEYTYTEFLGDRAFQIGSEPMSEDTIVELLSNHLKRLAGDVVDGD